MSEQHGHDDYFVRVTPPTGDEATPPPAVEAPARAPRGRTVALVLGLAALAALTSTVALVDLVGPDGSGDAVVPADAPAAVAGASESDTIVGDGFRLWARRDDGTPVRWNPCEPIAWVLNPDGAPPTAMVDVEEAFGRLAVATGLEFTFAGTTDEVPSRERRLLQEQAYGHRWAPVLVAWVETGETTLPLAHNERGAAVPVAAAGPEGNVFVSGQIVLNGSVTLDAGFEGRHASWGATLLHELGHLVGLDHVDDRTQLMYPTAVFGSAQYSDGDLRGLAAVGASGGCLEVPPPQDLDVDFSGFEH